MSKGKKALQIEVPFSLALPLTVRRYVRMDFSVVPEMFKEYDPSGLSSRKAIRKRKREFVGAVWDARTSVKPHPVVAKIAIGIGTALSIAATAVLAIVPGGQAAAVGMGAASAALISAGAALNAKK